MLEEGHMKFVNRYAIYVVPEGDCELARLGSAFLGRDCETGTSVSRPALQGITPKRLAAMTAEAKRYGLHITLKAPFFLKPNVGESKLLQAAKEFAAKHEALVLPRLVLSRLGSFFVLIPATDTPESGSAAQKLHTLANSAVKEFDCFRNNPTKDAHIPNEIRGLTLRQQQNLVQWGYPYVFDDYQSHFTLTDRLRNTAESRHMESLLSEYFTPAFLRPLEVTSICVCRQSIEANGPSLHAYKRIFLRSPYREPFVVLQRFPLQTAVSPQI